MIFIVFYNLFFYFIYTYGSISTFDLILTDIDKSTKIVPKPILKTEINIAFGKLIIRKSKVFIKDLNNFDMEIYNIN